MAEDEKDQTIDNVRTGQSFEKIEDQREGGTLVDLVPVEVTVERSGTEEPDDEVGYKRPPKKNRIKPGERRNPRGRPRGSPNQKTAVLRALSKKVPVQRGEKTSMVQVMQAMTEIFASKAIKGDRHAAGVVISLATKAGILDGRPDAENEGSEPVAARAGRPSDALLERVDPKLLSKDERIDLSRIAKRIDDGGDVSALSSDEFARLKRILNKGRGKNIMPQVDENLDQAA